MSTSITFSRRLVGLLRLDVKLENVTGLLIQMPIAAQAYRIGGADRYPMVARKRYSIRGADVDLEVPYIPGSSLKGRMRALVELALGRKLYTTDGKIWSHVRNLFAMDVKDFVDDVLGREVVDELFGWASANYKQIVDTLSKSKFPDPTQKANQIFSVLSPTRLLVSDFFPTEDYIQIRNVTSVSDFLEEKPENRIDRVTSAADPREVVRVKPGVVFGGTITLLLFDHDKDKIDEYLDTLLLGFKLVEETYIGSSGSRGYGRVKFVGESALVYKVNSPANGQEVLKKLAEVPFKSLEELEKSKAEIAMHLKSLYQ